MEQVATLQKSEVRPDVTLQQALRAQALGELQNCEANELREFKRVISAKVTEVQSMIMSTNQFFSRVVELNRDVRWYIMVETEIDNYLAREFHAR